MVSIYDVGVHCKRCNNIVEVEPPSNKLALSALGSFLLGAIGFFIGLSVGVATAGLGIAAWPFTIVIGFYVGYRLGKWSARKHEGVACPACDYNFENEGSFL